MQLPRTRTLLITVAVVASTALAACGGDDDDSSSDAAAPTAADLDGREFVATDIEGHTIVDGTEVVFSFSDGSLSIQGGCNTQNGGYEVVDGVLEVPALMATMMACEEALMAQDQLIADVVTSGPTIGLDGDDLTIASDDVTMSLTAQG